MMTRCRPSEGGSCIGAFISSYAAVEYLVISFEPRAPDYSTIHHRCNSREFTTYMKFPRHLVRLWFWCCAGGVIRRIAFLYNCVSAQDLHSYCRPLNRAALPAAPIAQRHASSRIAVK